VLVAGEQHLDRQGPPEVRVGGAVDDAHAAVGDLPRDPVAPHLLGESDGSSRRIRWTNDGLPPAILLGGGRGGWCAAVRRRRRPSLDNRCGSWRREFGCRIADVIGGLFGGRLRGRGHRPVGIVGEVRESPPVFVGVQRRLLCGPDPELGRDEAERGFPFGPEFGPAREVRLGAGGFAGPEAVLQVEPG
jgi:hypothetical protein